MHNMIFRAAAYSQDSPKRKQLAYKASSTRIWEQEGRVPKVSGTVGSPPYTAKQRRHIEAIIGRSSHLVSPQCRPQCHQPPCLPPPLLVEVLAPPEATSIFGQPLLQTSAQSLPLELAHQARLSGP